MIKFKLKGSCVKDLDDCCVSTSSMSVGVSIGVLTLQDVNKAVMFSISLAWQLGRTVEWARKIHSNVLQAIASQQNGKILLVGKVSSCALLCGLYLIIHVHVVLQEKCVCSGPLQSTQSPCT